MDEIVDLGVSSNKLPSEMNSINDASNCVKRLEKDPNIPDIAFESLDIEFQKAVELEKVVETNNRRHREGRHLSQGDLGIGIIDQTRTPKYYSVTQSKMASDSSETSRTSGSSVIWRKLQSRLSHIHKQWEEAREEVRQSGLTSVDIHPHTAAFLLRKKTGGRRASTSRSHQRAASDRNNSNYQRTDAEINNIRNGSRRNTLVRKNEFEIESNLSVAYRVRLHEILGVQASASTAAIKNSDRWDVGDDNLVELNHGLNLHRIHQLQRDLVDFAEAAFSMCSDKNFHHRDKGSFHLRTDPVPIEADEVVRQSELLAMACRSQDLLLHLACLAPLTPLSSPNPWVSTMTGMESLEKEVRKSSSSFHPR